MKKLLVIAAVSAALISLAPLSAIAGGGGRGGGWNGGGGGGGNWHGGGGNWRGGGGNWRGAGGNWHGGGGNWHGGGHWHGGWRGGFWGPRIAVGFPYWPYGYYGGYYPPYYGGYYGGYYGSSVVYADPPAVYSGASQAYAASEAPAPPAVDREVVFPHGRYVLRGDGVTTAYRWVWIPNPAPIERQ